MAGTATFNQEVIPFMLWIETLFLIQKTSTFTLIPTKGRKKKKRLGSLLGFNQIFQGYCVLVERSGLTLRSLFITNQNDYQTQGWMISQWVDMPTDSITQGLMVKSPCRLNTSFSCGLTKFECIQRTLWETNTSISVVLSTFTLLYNHHHYWFPKSFHHLKQKLQLFKQ